MNRWHLLNILIINSFITINALTFNVNISNLAQVDIVVALTPVPDPTSILSTEGIADVIADYSFYITQQNRIFYWQALRDMELAFSPEPLFSASERAMIPIMKSNPFSIILGAVDIQSLAARNVSQVYVLIRQRLYRLDPSSGKLSFYKYSILKAEYVPINAIIDVTANGLISPDQNIPLSLQNTYQIASGSAI